MPYTFNPFTANFDYYSTGGASSFVNDEVVTRVSGTSWTLASTPLVGTEHIFAGGARLTPGAGNDYTISGTAITTVASYPTGALLADYQTA
jgi:hypothetical protein